MNPFYGKLIISLGLLITILIRIPYDKKTSELKIDVSKKNHLETFLLILVALGVMLLPLISILTPAFSFADYELQPIAFYAGVLALIMNIWLFYRSHADLGTNWSKTLELKEGHNLITSGVYKKIRHPMYTAIFLYVIAQFLLLANWITGPAGLIAFSTMYLLRIKSEEKMMLEKFGSNYESYIKRTKKLIPGFY